MKPFIQEKVWKISEKMRMHWKVDTSQGVSNKTNSKDNSTEVGRNTLYSGLEKCCGLEGGSVGVGSLLILDMGPRGQTRYLYLLDQWQWLIITLVSPSSVPHFYLFVFVWMYVCGIFTSECVEVGGQLETLVLLLPCVPWGLTQAIRLGGNFLYSQSHLHSQMLCFKKNK